MTGIGSLIKDGIGQAANAMYETVLSPMLTWLGGIMFAQGRALLNCGFSIWKSCTQVALNFVQKNPEGQFGAWSIVSGSGVYGVFLAIAGSLTIFYFVAWWLKESIDIRSTFSRSPCSKCLSDSQLLFRAGDEFHVAREGYQPCLISAGAYDSDHGI